MERCRYCNKIMQEDDEFQDICNSCFSNINNEP